MAARTKIFEGTPAGAVFEATQKSLRALNFTLKNEDPAALSITAKSGMSMKSFGQEIKLKMVEVGPATELKVDATSGQLSDWGEGKAIIDRIIAGIESEISKIRAEGRISPVSPAVYGMGQVTQKKSEPPIDVTSKKGNDSGGSWIFRAIAALAVFWLISSESGGKLLSSIFGSFGVETDIAKYDCEIVSALFKGETLQNAFGGKFEIVTISAVTAVSKTSAKIVCNGEMGLSNGTTQLMRMSVEKGAGASEVLYRAEPL